MVTISTFNGPITDMAICEWLSGCEDTFENWEDENTGKKLTDKQKVHAAGNSISKAAPTDKLHSWWTTTRKTLETKKWDDFRDSVKEKALGSGWRLQALKKLYTASQGAQALEDYFTALDNMRFVISRSSNLTEIEDFEFKCHLLFRALPSLTTQALKNDVRDSTFISASVDDIKDQLRKYADEVTVAPTVTNLGEAGASGMWILGQAWGPGGNYGSHFTDLSPTNLPPASQLLTHLKKITVWSNNDTSVPIIQGYEMQFDDRTFRNPPSIYNGNVSQSIQFGIGEYISQVQMWSGTNWTISCLEITSSKGQSLLIGSSTSNRFTHKAPAGWRIVGFHGMANYYNNNRYSMPSLGAICAPVV